MLHQFLLWKKESQFFDAKLSALAILLISLVNCSALAQTNPAISDSQRQQAAQDFLEAQQRQRAIDEALERERQQKAPNVVLPKAPAPVAQKWQPGTPETPCFTIQSIQFIYPEGLNEQSKKVGGNALMLDPFYFLHPEAEGLTGHCLGKEGINQIVKLLTAKILDRAYTTTRLGIPEQDLSKGELKLALIPGIIRNIKFADESLYGTWRNAFPVKEGDLLNLRDLEQGLEQMKRLTSQEVEMDIKPGTNPGESDVILKVKRDKPWKITLNLDDSGNKTTGKYQAGLNLAVDNPLGISDIFNIGFTNDIDRLGVAGGSRSGNAYYSVPYGNWLFTASGGSNRYHQQIAGANQTFVSSGESSILDLKAAYLFHRNQEQKSSLQFRIGKKWNFAFIDDTEINVQRRETTFAEIALVHRHYFGRAQLDATLAYRQGMPWLGAQDEDPSKPDTSPTTLYRLQTLDVSFAAPFTIGSDNNPTQFKYFGTFRGQLSQTPLYATEFFSIGNRWTVRGFDGNMTLMAEKGFFLRNDLEYPLGNISSLPSVLKNLSLYIGLDYGQVYGKNVSLLLGNKLAGAAIGVRGNLFKGAYLDVFTGWALYKPQGFPTTEPAAGFMLTYQY